MARSATLAIRIVSDAQNAAAGFDQAESRVGGFQRRLDTASVAAGGVLAAVGAMASGAIDSASRLQQAGGAVESVFGAQAAAVQAAAEGAAQSVGLASSEYGELASVLGSQLKNMGTAAADLAPQTDQLIALGADLAATYGGTTADAVAALSSLLRGETDPIERYGVSIKQADINARLAATGMEGLEGPAAKAAQAQAVLGLLADQTGSALGAFARESDTAAGAQQRAAAEAENAKAKLGEALLPVVTLLSEKLAGLATFVAENSDAFLIIAGVIAGVAAGIILVNGAIRTYQAITAIATAAQWLWNAAMSANPIGLIVLLVTGLIGLGVLLYNKFKPFRDLVQSIVGFFRDAWNWVSRILGSGIGAIADFFSAGSTPPPAGGGAPAAGGAGMMLSAGRRLTAGTAGAMSSLSPGAMAAGSAGSSVSVDARTYVTVDGALDPDGVARQVRTLLDRRDKNLGLSGPLVVGMGR
jgi:hypothetical protein